MEFIPIMCHSEHAVARLTSRIQQTGIDSTGNKATTLKAAGEVAAILINQLLDDPLIDQRIQEALDSIRYSRLPN